MRCGVETWSCVFASFVHCVDFATCNNGVVFELRVIPVIFRLCVGGGQTECSEHEPDVFLCPSFVFLSLLFFCPSWVLVCVW